MSKITTGQLYQEWKDINTKLLTQIGKQDDIIAKQQDIIDRLNKPLDTQLTGSNVEDGNPIPIKELGRNLAIKDVNADSGGIIEAGAVKVVEVAPPEGFVWKTPLIWVRALSLLDATEGNHQIELMHGMNRYQYLILRAVSSHGMQSRIMSNIAESADVAALPVSETTQQNAIQSLVITKDYPLFVSYRNDTDGDQTRNLQIRLIVTEERIS